MIYDLVRKMFNRKTPAGNVNIFTKPYIFLITSTIKFSKNSLSYSHTRSVFSAEERLEQTLHTIDSIRTKVPDAIVILLENSNLFPKEVSVLQNKVDWLVSFSQDARAVKLRDGPYKGAAEAYMLRYMQNILKYFSYNIMFKLSGRYCLSERFNIQNFSQECFGILLRDGVYSTRLYSVPKILNNLYYKQLYKSMQAALKGESIESVFLRNVAKDKIQRLEYLGVQGYISPNGNFIDE